MFATWDLLAPGIELTDQGPAQVGGRTGRKIAVKLFSVAEASLRPSHSRSASGARSGSIEAVSGEVVLDTEKGVPLHGRR